MSDTFEILDSHESLDGGGVGPMTGFRIPIVSDAAEWVGEAAEDAWDLVDDFPVLKQLGEGTKKLFTGPLREFAKGWVGQTVLRALTGGLMQGAGMIAGPWAMMVAASVPGMVAGLPFEEALITENLYRATEAVKILTANQVKIPGIEFPIPKAVTDVVKDYEKVLDKLKQLAAETGLPIEESVRNLARQMGVPDDLEAAARKLADQMGVRQDFAVQAFEMASKKKLLQVPNALPPWTKAWIDSQGGRTPISAYDPATGRYMYERPEEQFQGTFAAPPPKVTVTAPRATSTTVQNTQMSRLRSAFGLPVAQPSAPAPAPAPVAPMPVRDMGIQATLAALQSQQNAAVLDRVSPPEEPSFFAKNKTLLLVGGGVAVLGFGLYVWSRR